MSAILSLAALLAGCDTPSKDDTVAAGRPSDCTQRPRRRPSSGNYENAVKLYERLEGRAAGTLLAQQAQIERAYYLWKSGEKAQALSTLERFIKLHPTSAALDYALYLQGLINFNDNLGFLGSLAGQDLSRARPAGLARLLPVVQPAGRAVPAVDLRRRCARCG